MRAREYTLMEEAVEVGVRLGWARAYKHTDKPDEDAIHAAIENAVMTEICERFIFEPEDET